MFRTFARVLVAAVVAAPVLSAVGAPVRAEPVEAVEAVEMVEYTTFGGDVLQLEKHLGEHVAILIDPDSHDYGAPTFPGIQTLLGAYDAAFEFYARVVGAEPRPWKLIDGRLSIAAVPSTCGAGCGYLGFTGIEVLEPYFYAGHELAATTGEIDQIVFYELGRNFWLHELDERINYPADPMGAGVVTGFAVTNRFWAYDATGIPPGPFSNEPLSALRDKVMELDDAYRSDPQATWANTIGDNAAYANAWGLGPESLVQAVLDQLATWFGTTFVDNVWLAALEQDPSTSREHAAENLIRAASSAACANLSDQFAGRWKWPVSPELTDELAAGYGAPWQVGDPTGCDQPPPPPPPPPPPLAKTYRVTVRHESTGQPVSSPVVAFTKWMQQPIFDLGRPASPGLRALAENGTVSHLLDELGDMSTVRAVGIVGGQPLVPTDPAFPASYDSSASVVVTDFSGKARFVQVAAKLLCTNDGFTGFSTRQPEERLPGGIGETVTYWTTDYDAGTERNTERYRDLPSACQEASPGSDTEPTSDTSNPGLAQSGVVRRHRGLTGRADLDPTSQQWRRPILRVVITRLS